MKLKRFLLRYYPPGMQHDDFKTCVDLQSHRLRPGVILEYERRDGSRNTKIIDLLHLTPEADLDALATQVVREEPLISESRKPQLRRLLDKLVEKQLDGTSSRDFCK